MKIVFIFKILTLLFLCLINLFLFECFSHVCLIRGKRKVGREVFVNLDTTITW